MGFQTYRIQQLQQPIAGPFDELLADTFGAMQDRELALLRVAALARLPATCPDDGTDLLLGWFGLDRYPADTPATIRARCSQAFPLYELGGSPQSMIDAIKLLGVTDVRVLTEGHDGPIYAGSWYSRGRVILGPNMGTTGWTGSKLASSMLLGSFLLGTSMTPAERSTVKRLAWAWKDAYGFPHDVYIVNGGGSLLGVTSSLGDTFYLAEFEWQTAALTIVPQFGTQTTLGSWVLGSVDLT